jgi:hypothetical protein
MNEVAASCLRLGLRLYGGESRHLLDVNVFLAFTSQQRQQQYSMASPDKVKQLTEQFLAFAIIELDHCMMCEGSL